MIRTVAWWVRSLVGGFTLGVVACMVLFASCAPQSAAASPALRQHAATPANAPAKVTAGVAACVQHYNLTSDVNYSSSNGVTVYSNAGWSRSLWSWDTCYGGIKFVSSLDPDCHFRTRQWVMNASGDTTTYRGVVGDRGGTCNARPGKMTWQTNGAVKTWSAAGTQLSATPYTSASPFKWRLYLDACDAGEQILNTSGGQYFDFWFSPRWNFC